jgi:RNA polymerase sigma-70 factor (ECF subfamily)
MPALSLPSLFFFFHGKGVGDGSARKERELSDQSRVERAEKRDAIGPAYAASDAGLVTRLHAGDLSALRDIMAAHGPHLTIVAGIITGSPDLAAEAVQDAFVSLWESRMAIDPVRGVRGYLTTVVSRRARNILRHERAQSRVHRMVTDHARIKETATYNDATADLEARELDARVHAALAALPPRCREIFLLRQDARLSYAEIEAQLGISNATIRNQLSRAMQAIARTVKEWHQSG